MWLMLQQDSPEDYVISTGETHTVREFVELAFQQIGIEIKWQGLGKDEKGIDAKTGKVLVEIDERYFRPLEVDILLGDATKAKKKLNWQSKTKFQDLVKIMLQADLEYVRNKEKK